MPGQASHFNLSAEFAERCEARGEYDLAAAHWRDAMRDSLLRAPRNMFRDRLRRAQARCLPHAAMAPREAS